MNSLPEAALWIFHINRDTTLGNDETHYERRWTDKDIQDLKRLLTMTINAIDNELLAKKYEAEMKEKK